MRAKIPIGLIPRKRYVALELKGELDARRLISLGTKAVQELYGILGASELKMALKYYEESIAIIETTNRDLPKVLTALSFALFRSGLDAQLKVKGVYGTIKKCFQMLKRQNL